MGKTKLLFLSSLFFGQLTFACGTTMSGGAGHSWQGNTSSQCPNTNLSAFGPGPVMTTQQTPNYSPAAHKEMTCAQKYGEALGKKNGCKTTANNIYLAELDACPVDTRVLAALPSVIEAETQPSATCIGLAKTKNDITKENCDLDFETASASFPLYCNKDGSVKKDSQF